MKFNHISKENEAKGMSPEVLEFNDSDNCWYGPDGTSYKACAAENPVPISNKDDVYESLPGYFIVEVKDPNGVIGTFKLYSVDGIVSCGTSFLYPGVTCDDQVEGEKLKAMGLARPDMDFDFLPHVICYGVNEGAVVDGTIELEPWDEAGIGISNPDAEQPYHWHIV